jgi:diguanylate cyclase (GGDEF)-like protein
MIRVPSFVKESSTFLRNLLLVYWLGGTIVISLVLAMMSLLEQRRHLMDRADQASHIVESSFSASLTEQDRQALIRAVMGLRSKDRSAAGIKDLLVLDQAGTIVYASQAAWLGLPVADPSVLRDKAGDAVFQTVVDCFKRGAADCLNLRSPALPLRVGGFVVVRPIARPAVDLGLPRRPYLVISNFDGGMVMSDFVQGAMPLLLVAILLSTTLTLGLWLALAGLLLPRLAESAQTDGLTRLMNRTSFMEAAMEMLADAEESNTELVFAILDIDHFKAINDTHGHDCGDVALVSVSAVLTTVLRPDDLVCRFGGEEFALLLCTSKDSARKALERLRLQVEMNRIGYSGRQLSITASFGAAATSDCGYNLDYLYTTADKALYAAKNRGRNRVEWTDGESLTRLQLIR